MTFDPAWFAAVVSVGALVVLAISHGDLLRRIYEVENKLREQQTWIIECDIRTRALSKGRNIEDADGWYEMNIPPGTRMPEMEERKS